MSDLYVEFKALEKTIDHSDSMTQLEGSMQFNLRARDAVSVTKTMPMFHSSELFTFKISCKMLQNGVFHVEMRFCEFNSVIYLQLCWEGKLAN